METPTEDSWHSVRGDFLASSTPLASVRRRCGSPEQPHCLSRRSLLHGALLGGAVLVAPSVATAFGAPLAIERTHATPLQRSSGTLTLVTNRAPSDLDPHSAYDAGSGVLLQGPFEGLIRT